MTRKEYFDLRTQIKSHFTHERVKNQSFSKVLKQGLVTSLLIFAGLLIVYIFEHGESLVTEYSFFLNISLLFLFMHLFYPSDKEIDKAEKETLETLRDMYKHHSVDEMVAKELFAQFFTD